MWVASALPRICEEDSGGPFFFALTGHLEGREFRSEESGMMKFGNRLNRGGLIH